MRTEAPKLTPREIRDWCAGDTVPPEVEETWFDKKMHMDVEYEDEQGVVVTSLMKAKELKKRRGG